MKRKTQNAFSKAALTKSEREMAKALGISEEALRRSIRSVSESWKDPMALRIRRMYDERSGKASGEWRFLGLSEKEKRMAEELSLDPEKLSMIRKRSGDPEMFSTALYVRRRYEKERRAT